jgi:hypothetical protein
MKRFLMLLALCMPLAYTSNTHSTSSEAQLVYICTGPQSKVYHKHSNCKGLRNCSKDIKQITLDKAKSMNRRACKLCY